MVAIPKILAKALTEEAKVFARYYINAEDVISKSADSYPFHNLQQPAKGWLQLFFMQVADGAKPDELGVTYAHARETFIGLIGQNMMEAKTTVALPPDASASDDDKDTYRKQEQEASCMLDMISELASVLSEEDSHEILVKAIEPSLKKLKKSSDWQNHGQTFLREEERRSNALTIYNPPTAA